MLGQDNKEGLWLFRFFCVYISIVDSGLIVVLTSIQQHYPYPPPPQKKTKTKTKQPLNELKKSEKGT
jgi:hypothetical protein